MGIWTRRPQPLPTLPEEEEATIDLGEVSLFDLLGALKTALVRYDREHPPPLQLSLETYSVRGMFDRLMRLLDAGHPYDLIADLRGALLPGGGDRHLPGGAGAGAAQPDPRPPDREAATSCSTAPRASWGSRPGGDRLMIDRSEMEAALEAILFVSSEPVPRAKLLELFDEGGARGGRRALERCSPATTARGGAASWWRTWRGGVRLATRPEVVGWLRRFFDVAGGEQAVDGGAGDAGDHRLPAADDRPGDPGAARRQRRRGCSRPCSSGAWCASSAARRWSASPSSTARRGSSWSTSGSTA